MYRKEKTEMDVQRFVMEDMSDEKQALLDDIWDSFKAADDFKADEGMYDKWRTNYNYWAGDVNLPTSTTDPGSETNIIKPIIESQVADLVEADYDIMAHGEEPSDEKFSDDVSHVLKYVMRKNKLEIKLDESERDRLNLGTSCYKVYYDKDLLKGKGMVVLEPKDINLLFPDPKVSHPWKLQKGEFFIEAMPMSLHQIRHTWPKTGQYVMAEGNWNTETITQIQDNDGGGSNDIINDVALVLEYWVKDEDLSLRRVYATKDIILEDSYDDNPHEGEDIAESFYKHGNYPFVMIPCYLDKNSIWGRSDTEDLIPIQDMINDLDDQIRMNARLMGNTQIVVGLGAGINLKKWTNLPGLKIRAKDPTAFKVVQPGTLPYYIGDRRNQGFNEAEIISGRTDVTEGRRTGSLRAAAAIAALQEAGSRRANHKRLMLLKGMSDILDLVLEYIKEFMDEERCFKIIGKKGKSEYKWFKGTDLNEVPVLKPNKAFNPLVEDPGTEEFVPNIINSMDEETGEEKQEVETKEIDVDLSITFGSGLPNNGSFLYQSAIELARENIITQEEARMVVKKAVNYPIIKPEDPVGSYAGRNSSAEQLQVANGQPVGEGQVLTDQPVEQQPVQPGGADPAAMLKQLVSQLPPEVVTQIMNSLQGQGGQSGMPGQGGGF